MSHGSVFVTIEAGVGTCELSCPETRNALGQELRCELSRELEALDQDESVRCIVIAGSNEVFASGGELRPPGEGEDPAARSALADGFWEHLAGIRKPIVAAVSGWALGSGCELALACDMCVAAEKSQFGQPEVTLGILPGGGAGQRLARVIGKQRAMELLLTGRRFSAEQAFAWGLVNRVAPRTGWLEAGRDLAAEVAARAPIAVQLGKQTILAAEQSPIREALEAERELHEQTMETEDRVEGINAFFEGRPPEFEGR